MGIQPKPSRYQYRESLNLEQLQLRFPESETVRAFLPLNILVTQLRLQEFHNWIVMLNMTNLNNGTKSGA